MQNKLKVNAVADSLVAEFQELTGTCQPVPKDLCRSLTEVLTALGNAALRPTEERRRELWASVNAKLSLNAAAYRQILDAAAAGGILFHYHDKAALQRALDTQDRGAFLQVLLRADVPSRTLREVAACFRPASWDETEVALRAVMASDERALLIYRSIFSAYAFSCFQMEAVHRYFAGDGAGTYSANFYQHLRHTRPEVFDRPTGLAFLRLDDAFLGDMTAGGGGRDRTLTTLSGLTEPLANHCFLAVLIKPLLSGTGAKWRLYSDLVLYAEKARATPLRTGYFHPDKISAQTSAYIPGLDVAACQFQLAEEGLFYKDCFVITYPAAAGELQSEPDLLLLFEKNERDETPIPCPACRSWNVRGNSYPVLGVRSWECINLLCPERSKYDRGNRYSAASLIRQEAIEEQDAIIPTDSLRRWKRDVVTLEDEAEVLAMLVRHYSLLGDRILVVNSPVLASPYLGRRIVDGNSEVSKMGIKTTPPQRFFDGPFFHRFCVERPHPRPVPLFPNLSQVKDAEVYCGDCFEVLEHMPDNSVDGIVTSPPYYNAREYAQWPNIYCFLYDQYNVARQLHRVLKPGGLFLYNIFDYFDNENNIVFSAMGKKRMILGAYAINLFERSGFELVQNVVWDKGEIEGKRNFNQGNCSPYYQAPFNCWEHLLTFRKPGPGPDASLLPFLLQVQPVVKMIRGKNVLGHTAPYPEAIPKLLVQLLEARATILDCYAGSMTTARAAYRGGMRSVSIDYKPEYCELGLRLFTETRSHLINAEATLQPSHRPLLYDAVTLKQAAQIGLNEALS